MRDDCLQLFSSVVLTVELFLLDYNVENVIADILISEEFPWDADNFNSQHE